MKSNSMVIGVGICAGLLLVAGIGKNDFLKIGIVSALLAIPTGLIAHRVGDTEGSRRVSFLEDELSKSEKKLKLVDLNLLSSEAKLKAALENTKKLSTELSDVQQILSEIKTESEVNKASAQIFEPIVNSLQADLTKAQLSIQEWGVRYENLVAESEKSFEKAVDEKLKVAKAREIARVSAENDAITDEAMEIMEELQRWTLKAQERHEGRRDYNNRLRESFDERLDLVKGTVERANEAFNHEQEQYLIQLDCAHQRIANLQRQVAGDLTEPEYKTFGYTDDARIADALQRRIWDFLNVPLSAKGFKINSDGSAEAGYGYGLSTPIEALISDLSGLSKAWAKEIGIHSIHSIKKYELGDLLVISWRRYPQAKASDVERLLTPLDKFTSKVINAMTKKGTVRVMGSTGDGKGVVSRFLVSKIVESQNWYIRLHDPKHGSDEDYWGIPKISKSGDEMKLSLKAISKQLEERDKTKITKPVTLDILDEIDNQLDKTDREQFLELVGQIRHNGMKLFLIGQNPGVGRVGFQWTDMGQMICLYQKSASLTAIENLKQLKPQKDKLNEQYKMIAEYCENLNTHLPDEKQYLFGLCIIPDEKPIWYVLPAPDSVEINDPDNLIGETFSIPVSLQEFVGSQNLAKSGSNSAQTNKNSTPCATAEALINQGVSTASSMPEYGGIDNTASILAKPSTPTCKKHPIAELTVHSNGQVYCKSCKKKLPKSEIEYR